MPAPLPRPIAAYYAELQSYAAQHAAHEGNTRQAFGRLLSDSARTHGLTLLTEQTIKLPNRRTIRLDGEVRDQFTIQRGVWEAKDTGDDLDAEIRKKIDVGYPLKNTIFENTRRAVLFQNDSRVLDVDITQPANLQRLLGQFFEYSAPQIDQFHRAVAEFKRQLPDLARSLTEIIDGEKQHNRQFVQALDEFLTLCRASLNPQTSLHDVEDMLKQHLLTERIFRSVFDNPDFVQRNAIARELEKVVRALTSRSFSRDQFLRNLNYFYEALERAAQTINDYVQKQSFLNAVYEQFFQGYSIDTADTHGIVYTPAPLVQWMVRSVEGALRREFDLSLSDEGVHVLDPCVGTGTFMLHLLNTIQRSALQRKYAAELHCNEVLLLPYYIAAQNIEHEYYERTGTYAPFEGICFADTLDMGGTQMEMFAPENTERVKKQEDAPIFVIIGNPPYNSGQQNENDNNKNRKHPDVDKRIRDTYVKSSVASSFIKVYDMYVRFFRWATDRLHDHDGIVCFVSNNSFLDQIAFDGMRKELLKDFTAIYTLDLGGNVRQNPKLSGTTHNVFGIQVGVAITLLIRNRKGGPQTEPAALYYARVDEWWRKEQKYEWLDQTASAEGVEWQRLAPNARGAWINIGGEEFDAFVPLGTKDAKAGKTGAADTILSTYSLGVRTNRDDWAYDWNRDRLVGKMHRLTTTYNSEVDRWKRTNKAERTDVDNFVQYDDTRIKWSRDLKLDLQRGRYAVLALDKLRTSLYRPFCKNFLFLDRICNEEVYMQPNIFPNIDSENVAICASGIGSEKPFGTFMCQHVPDLNFFGPGTVPQWFPFYTYDEDGTNRRENITDWALGEYQRQYGADVTKWDMFYGIYGLLHAPEYRATYAGNLKRDLPRIPFVAPEAWRAFVEAGRRLATLHVGYEEAAPYKLRHIENNAVPWTWRVEKMRLSADKTQLVVNEALTLAGIPAEVWEYRLGNRSALDWVIDQYRVKTDARSGIVSDPNRSDDPEYIVRLVKQVIAVSVETARIVGALPAPEPVQD